MIDIDLLLSPIRADGPAGEDLRYDPVYDQINEARTEDDPTLPTGSWGRQPKRADLPLVLRLTRETLARRSKDLWLAVWLGHAELMTEGIGALPAVLRLLLALQERFPEALYPEIEDGDAGARSAPLQWGLEQYAGLIAELPSVAPGVGYHAYKTARLGTSSEATETLDAALASTSKAFLIEGEALLAEARRELEPLYLYCEEFYGQEGPSFAKLRRTLEEVHGLIAGLLRERRELDPDVQELPTTGFPLQQMEFAEEPRLLPVEPYVDPVPEQTANLVISERSESVDAASFSEWGGKLARPTERFADVPQSREEATAQLATAARFLAEDAPTDPSGYVVLASRCWAEVLVGAGSSMQAPSSEVRLQMRTLRREERWVELLHAALAALASGSATRWLDAHRDVWMAARHMGAEYLAASAIEIVRLLVAGGAAMHDRFDDETPIASDETRQWLMSEVVRESPCDVAEAHQAPEAMPLAATDQVARGEAVLSRIGVGSPGALDPIAEANTLAIGGDLQAAVALLMADGEASAGRRTRFLRKLEIARLCFASGALEVARRVLERLRSEVTECGVLLWEGPQVGAEVLYLLLQCQAAGGAADVEAQAELMTELCALDPVRALQLHGGR